MTTISERMRRGPLAYATTHSRVYAGPTLQDTEAADTIDALVAALEATLGAYVETAESGDAGFWNAEDEDHVKASRAALAKAKGKQE